MRSLIELVRAGDVLRMPADSVFSSVRVLDKCRTQRGRWYCATHQIRFDNQFKKDVHVHEGIHRLAWSCDEHGLEVP